MPVLDMDIEKLRQYRGVNPKPRDFDRYWEEALQELQGVDPQVEMVEAEFQTPFATCYHMYFTGVRGARLYARLLIPKERREKLPALAEFHGYSGSSLGWHDKLKYAASGMVVASLDCRGQGGRSEDVGGTKGTTYHGQIIRGIDGPPQDMTMRHIYLDCVQLVRLLMAMDEVDESKVYVTGGSQGGGLSLACAALEPRVARAGLRYPFLSDFKRVWDMDLCVNAYEELRYYFRWFDPLHERETEVFTRLGYLDVHHLAPRIKAEVLMGISLQDNIVPPSTQFAAYNSIQSPKEALLYWDYGHEDLLGYHDRVYQFFLRP